MTVGPDDEIIVISTGTGGANVAHTRECESVVKAGEKKVRRVKRKQHPNVPLCKHCTEPTDRSKLNQSTVYSDIKGAWAND